MKKGFTLIELIMVICLLGIIAIITVPVITKLINNSKDESYKEQKKLVINAAKQYMTAEKSKSEFGISTCINVADLQKFGYLSKNSIKNPKYVQGSEEEEKNFELFDDGSVIVTASNEADSFQYSYEYSKDDCNNLPEGD